MQGKELQAEGKQLEIKVSDTGVGIEDEAKYMSLSVSIRLLMKVKSLPVGVVLA